MPSDRPHRSTRQRKIILEELRRIDSHPTAVELYETVRRRLPKISLGTVYRNLDLLAKQGTIQRLAPSGAETRFDAKRHPHYHVRCVRCGRIDDVGGFSPDPAAAALKEAGGYEILGHRLEFFGICPDCRRGQEEPIDRQKECPPC